MVAALASGIVSIVTKWVRDGKANALKTQMKYRRMRTSDIGQEGARGTAGRRLESVGRPSQAGRGCAHPGADNRANSAHSDT